METILSELLSDPASAGRYLSKNTSSVIIEYLTDPPPLPYIKELTEITHYMKTRKSVYLLPEYSIHG